MYVCTRQRAVASTVVVAVQWNAICGIGRKEVKGSQIAGLGLGGFWFRR